MRWELHVQGVYVGTYDAEHTGLKVFWREYPEGTKGQLLQFQRDEVKQVINLD